MTTAHRSQVAALGSALHSPGPRRQKISKARSEFDRAGQMMRMASQGYTKRYASQILGLSADQAYRLCKKYGIEFIEPAQKPAKEEWP